MKIEEIEPAAKFSSDWYEACLAVGVEPEEDVAKMGGIALVTNEELVEKFQVEGDVPSYLVAAPVARAFRLPITFAERRTVGRLLL